MSAYSEWFAQYRKDRSGHKVNMTLDMRNAWDAALDTAIAIIDWEANGLRGNAPCSGAFELGMNAAANAVRKIKEEE